VLKVALATAVAVLSATIEAAIIRVIRLPALAILFSRARK